MKICMFSIVIQSPNGSLQDVWCPNPQLVVAQPEIYLRKHSCTMKLVK